MKLKLTGVPPYDGEYPLDLERMTNRDAHIVKRISGYTRPEYMDAWNRGDTDFWVAIAVVMIQRSGVPKVNEEVLWNAEDGFLDIILDDDEKKAMAGDADPPQLSSVEQSA